MSADGRVLLLRRSQEIHRPGLWNFPGGRAEPGESAQETAVREAEEESGLVATDPVFLAVLDGPSGDYVVFITVLPGAVDPTLNWESDAYVWADPAMAAQHLPMLANLPPLLLALPNASRVQA